MAYTRPWFNCGPGMVEYMTQQGDTPAGPSKYTNYNANTMEPVTGSLPAHYVSVEECWGAQGYYRADNFQGEWRVSGPFTGAA